MSTNYLSTTRRERRGGSLRSPRVWAVGGFLLLSLTYYGCMTGFSGLPAELSAFPNYNMLAKSFLSGRLDLQDDPPEDYSLYRGKKYLYFGPAPALFHLPFLIFRWDVPSGLFVVLLTAGSWAVFFLILVRVGSRARENSIGPVEIAFGVMFAFNGFTFWMVSVPSIHHEAICFGTFFLLTAVYFCLKAAENSYLVSSTDATLIALSSALAMGSRFSYFLTITVPICFVLLGIFRGRKDTYRMRAFLPSAIIIGTIISAVTLLVAYNYARFGSPVEFGMKHLVSMYSDYLREENFFRYDHVPYNIWAYFFSLPLGDSYFPFVKLPFYVLKVQSVSPESYLLVHVNELCASVFCLMPVLLFCFVLAFTQHKAQESSQPRIEGFFAVLFVAQLAPLCTGMAAISRYCYDFLPIMIILAFLGIERVKDQFRFKISMLVMISLISIVFSLPVAVNCSRFYEPLYRSPLLRLW